MADNQDDLKQLSANIMKAATVVAIGKTEAERTEASKLYDELVEKREKLQAEIEAAKTDKKESDAAPDPYTRIADLNEQMLEAAKSNDMANYTSMRNEKNELIRLHGKKAPVITSVTVEEITERRRQQHGQDHVNRQRIEDEKANPPARSFENEGDIEKQMTEAAERGDHIEYGRLRRKRLKQKRA